MTHATTALPLLRLALDALDRPEPNLALAIGALRDVVGSVNDAEPHAPSPEVAVPIKTAAAALGYSPRHLRSLIGDGKLGDAVLGSGRATRIVVTRAMAALRGGDVVPRPTDEVESAGAAWARRSNLRVVDGGAR